MIAGIQTLLLLIALAGFCGLAYALHCTLNGVLGNLTAAVTRDIDRVQAQEAIPDGDILQD